MEARPAVVGAGPAAATRVVVEAPIDGRMHFDPFTAISRPVVDGSVTLTSTGTGWLPDLVDGDVVHVVPIGSTDEQASLVRVVEVPSGRLSATMLVEPVGYAARREGRDGDRFRCPPTPVTVVVDGDEVPGVVRDVSLGGLQLIGVLPPPRAGQSVTIVTEEVRLAATAVWVDGSRVGIAFDDGQRLAVVRLVRALSEDLTPLPPTAP